MMLEFGIVQVKAYIEEQRRFLIAGDSAYPISENLIKPYSTEKQLLTDLKGSLIEDCLA